MNPADVARVMYLIGQAQGNLDQAILIISHLSDPLPRMIPVFYRSQNDSDAIKSKLDCGPACVAMLLQWKGQNIAIDDISRYAGLGPTNSKQLIMAAAHWGMPLTPQLDIWPVGIKDLLDDGHPMIALVDYAKFGVHRQDTNYNGLHWVVIVGYDADNFYINDPDYWGARRDEGHQKPIPRDVFIEAQVTLPKGGFNRQVLIA